MKNIRILNFLAILSLVIIGCNPLKKMIELFEKAQNLYLEQKWDKAITMFNKSNEYEDMFYLLLQRALDIL